jgi:hypothetical protein
MDLTVEFYDENREPLPLPRWPGQLTQYYESLPSADEISPHRLTYTSAILGAFELSLSHYDTIGQIKVVLSKACRLPVPCTGLSRGSAAQTSVVCCGVVCCCRPLPSWMPAWRWGGALARSHFAGRS